MSRATREFFDSIKQVKEGVLEVAPGLRSLLPEMKGELSRLGTQGTMELASALFNGNAFVPYGPGQYTPTPEHEKGGVHGQDAQQAHQEHEQERGGREM